MKCNFKTILFLLLISGATSYSQIKLPFHTNIDLESVNTIECDELNEVLKTEINKNFVWKKLISQQKMAIGIVDLSDINNPKFAGINEQHMMYAASLPKIAVLFAVMDAIHKGEIEETESVTNDIKIMISKSSNTAATRLIDLVGFVTHVLLYLLTEHVQ